MNKATSQGATTAPVKEIWERHPSNPKLEIERTTGRLRTRDHVPGCVPTPPKAKRAT